MRYVISTSDEDTHRAHLDGPKWREAVEELASELRSADKYGQGTEDFQLGITWARGIMHRILEEAGLRLMD